MKSSILVRISLVGAALGAVATWYRFTRAQAAPSPAPVLYSGYLEDSGAPVTGSRSIGLNLWKSADTSSASNRACAQAPQDTSVDAGWFTVQLSDECVVALKRHPALQLQFVVGSTAFPLRPIGAVPYALRSSESSNGSRLRKIVRTAADGSREPDPERWWDELRSEECTFVPMSAAGEPASGLCLPPTSPAALPTCAGGYFTDAACTATTSIQGRVSTVPLKYLFSDTSPSHRVAAGSPEPVYCKPFLGSTTCTAMLLYSQGSDIPATEFVSWQDQVE